MNNITYQNQKDAEFQIKSDESEEISCFDCGACDNCKEWNTSSEWDSDDSEEYDDLQITYQTFINEKDGDKVMLFKYDGNKYDYSDELYWEKNEYEYKWFDLVIKEYNLKLGEPIYFNYKCNSDDGFMFWKKKRSKLINDFRICSKGHLWKAKIVYVNDISNVFMKKVKSNILVTST